MPAASGPASQPALAVLCSWLDGFDDRAQSRGRAYFKAGRVRGLGMDGNRISAVVEGSDYYTTALLWDQTTWTSTCSCPVAENCKHAHATGLAWVRKFDRSSALPPLHSAPFAALAAIPGVTTGAALPAALPRPHLLSFREQWTPLLAEKLGRPLAADEADALDRLLALFRSMSATYGRLSIYQMQQHGFAYSARAVGGSYGQLFEGWWDAHRPPADPWALWQYIAYDWERDGRPIPAVFRPMTDTAKVAAALEDWLLRSDLAEWRHALAAGTNPGREPTAATEAAKISDLRLRLGPKGGFFLEARTGPDKPWKFPAAKWLNSLATAGPADFVHLPPAAAALAIALAAECDGRTREIAAKFPLPERIAGRVLAYAAAHPAILLADGSPWRVEPGRLSLAAVASAEQPDRLDLQLLAPDGAPATGACLLLSHPEPLYEFHGRVFRGPPALPARKLPTQALADPAIMARLRAMDISLPAVLAARLHRVALRPVLRCRVSANDFYEGQHTFHAELFAHGDDPPCTQHWLGEGGWQWTADGAPAPRAPTAPILELDLAAANAVGARFADFKLNWNTYAKSWTRAVTRNFPDEFLDWRASLPPGLTIEAQGELAGLAGPPVRGHLDFSARPAAGDAGRDWFDLTVALRVEDTTLTAEEIALLLKARGKWVQLPRTGWRRLEIADSAETRATLDRLGLVAADLADTGRPVAHRIHALQLAREATALESRDAALAAALRERAAAITAIAPPAVPARLLAELRPYQREGFHFLAHLAANGLGGVLADDMGLGKTVQTLAWLLHLAENSDRHEPARSADQPAATDAVNATAPARRKPGRPKKSGAAATVASVPAAAPATTRAPAGAVRAFRVLVVCPKSVVHGWLTEAARFAPSLTIAAFTPALTGAPAATGDAQLLIANYAQLRLNAEWFQQQTWDAVILDEAQFIKNPTSLTAAVARSLATRHRLALTGTPVENRLLDLWSLLAFAQPGLLGTQAAFKRQHPDDDPGAPARLQRRAHHFLLRRTKAQVATDLPSRTEDEIVVELEPAQRQLYDAELKRARAQLLGLETDRALDAVRFNILSSLLRLRQICCHPALVDPAHADLPSAKLDALLERLEELRDEGHQVLVFSQFVGMLELIRARLVAAGIGHLLLIGATENRAELVEKFQRDRTQTVFLLSLKAAGFGLNLTAASYAILYDPWWNPAVEAQAIDRTHRIGQTRPVTAYRLLADNTIEQKIRLLQKEKATLAGAIVQEESLASVLDLESLKKILG